MDAANFNKRVRLSLFFPLLFTFVMWMVKISEWLFDFSLSSWGVLPRSFEHIYGILFSPFIHSDWKHLWANTIPFFVLSWALFFFYRTIAAKTFLLIYFLSGILLWCIGRDSFHIGMSSIIYGLAFFLITSGLIKIPHRKPSFLGRTSERCHYGGHFSNFVQKARSSPASNSLRR